MFTSSTWKHLRIPFSIFLMPFFCFALAEVPEPDWYRAILAFIAIHLFYNPASNGFNSYYDKDEKSIGGLERPPAVQADLLKAALIFDAIALLMAAFVNITFFVMLFAIGLVSKAYSHPAIRLKKYPVGGLITVALFQGAWTYWMSYAACGNTSVEDLLTLRVILGGILSSLLLFGSYPMTQVYQHEEDSKRGDQTFSLLIGIKGTFYWTAGVFALSAVALNLFFIYYYDFRVTLILTLVLGPTLIFFFKWAIEVFHEEVNADFKRTMTLNKLSSVSFIVFFLFLLWFHHWGFRL